jgi:hypothetical protein
MTKSKLLLTLVLLFNLSVSSAFAAPANCASNVERVSQTNYFKKNIKFASDVKVKSLTSTRKVLAKTFVKDIVKKHTGKAFTGSTFDDAIEAVYKSIKSKRGVKSLKKADMYAAFAKDLNPVLEEMIAKFPKVAQGSDGFLLKWQARREAVDQVKTIKFGMVERLSLLEEFKRADYKKVSKDEFLITRGTNEEVLTHMGIHEYEKYVDSYVHWKKAPDSAGAKLFEDIDPGSLGILSIHDIRDVNSYNLWPMYLKEHDMRHIHYGMSHPMALATVMQSTRSKSSLRYTMMGGLFEGVDRNQYSHETALNKWFSTGVSGSDVLNIKRNMDLEEALITIGLSSQKDLELISKATGSWDSMKSFVRDLEGWKPKYVEGSSTINGSSLRGRSNFRQDIDKMLEDYAIRNEKAEVLRKELLENPIMQLSDEQIHFMKMQNFQLSPENPEIVIDGLVFKNDGRGHYSRGGDASAPLGVGDQ